MSHKYKGK
jgi:hypothetical protein